MKAYRTNLGGGLASLTVREEQEPQPGEHDVVIRVRACSINRRDTMIVVDGRYPLPVRQAVIPLCDGAGEVVHVGNRVTRAKLGDRVMANVFAHWVSGAFDLRTAAQFGGSLDGMLAQYAVLPEQSLVTIPEHWAAAACRFLQFSSRNCSEPASSRRRPPKPKRLDCAAPAQTTS